uniref:Uncharacterized protein n=1 Tax=Arundo donax TaxID=35708 RepID=A0A0A9G2W4_ARUDO
MSWYEGGRRYQNNIPKLFYHWFPNARSGLFKF